MTDWVPPFVTEEANGIQQATGLIPIVEKISARRWRITIANDRVRMTEDIKMTGPGRCYWAGSTLDVDGKPRELARSFDELAEIFRNPDPRPVTAKPMPPAASITTAPPLVRQFHGMLTSHSFAKNLDIRVGALGNSRWVIGLDLANRASLRLTFRRWRNKSWGVANIQVIVDGVDRSAEADNQLGRALALIAGNLPSEPPSAGSPITEGSPAARTNSVEIRRATVIRN